jgi:hypothetical protein
MSANKLFRELEAGRLVIRGRVSGENPLLASISLHCITAFPNGIDRVKRLMHCRFDATAKVCRPLRFEVLDEVLMGQPSSLPATWRKLTAVWPHYWDEGQIAFTLWHELLDNVCVPEASVQVLPHLARCIDALNRVETDDFPHDANAAVYRDTAEVMVIKMRAIYTNLIKRWSLCVPVL